MASLEEARLSVDTATRAEAAKYARKEYQRAEELLLLGCMELARQKGRLRPFQDFSVADSLLTLASFTAQVATEHAQSRLRNLLNHAAGDRDDLKKDIQSWQNALEKSLLKNRSRPYLERANLNLLIGRRLMDRGEYEESMWTFAEGRRALAEMGQMVNEYSGEEDQKIDSWRKWVNDTVSRSRSEGSPAIIVDKSVHKLHLVQAGMLVRSYDCDLGYKPARQKLFAGDGATPEGTYRVVSVKNNGSKFYKALLIDYPNNVDRRRYEENRAKGIISKRVPIGGLIEIHGEGGRSQDWTNGCIALANRDMDHLVQKVSVGTPVTIVRKSDVWP